MKKLFKIILIILVLFIAVMAGGAFFMTRGLDSGAKLKLSGINPSSFSDGTYIGNYNAGRWSNEVEVTVKGGKITAIQLKKDVTFNKEGMASALFNKVIQTQNTNTVDAVSGATVTSKAYLKAVENALTK